MFTQWFRDHCTDPVDLDAGLIDVRDDPDARWTMRALAGHSIGMPVVDGHQAAHELWMAIVACADGKAEGKVKLAAILGANRNDYQRALYYALAGRGPFAMLIDLKQLVAMMKSRVEAASEAEALGLGVRLQTSPYLHYDGPDGPLGAYETDFDMAPAWEGIAQPFNRSNSD